MDFFELEAVSEFADGRLVLAMFIVEIIAELQREKRASEAPWVRKIGNPLSRENLVMTSAYERPSVRQTIGEVDLTFQCRV